MFVDKFFSFLMIRGTLVSFESVPEVRADRRVGHPIDSDNLCNIQHIVKTRVHGVG